MLMIFKDPPYGSWVDQRENLAAINDILCTKLVIVMLLYKVMGNLMHFVNDVNICFHCHLNVSISFSSICFVSNNHSGNVWGIFMYQNAVKYMK